MSPAIRVSERALPPEARRARVAAAICFGLQGLAFSTLLSHLPQFTSTFGLSQARVTVVVLTVVVLAGAGSLLSELLAAARSSRAALRAGLFGVAVTATVIGLAPGQPVLIGGFALYGIAVGAVDAATNMQAVTVQHLYGRSILTTFHAAWSAGAISGALYVSAGEYLGRPLRASVLVMAGAVLLIAAAAGSRLLPGQISPRTESMQPAGEVTAPDAPPAGSTTRTPVSTRTTLRLLGVAFACFWAVDSSVSSWGALYLSEPLGAPGSVAALGYAAYQVTGLGSRLIGDLAVRRAGGAAVIRLGALIGICGTGLVLLAGNPGTAIAGFALVGLGLPVVAPLSFSAGAAMIRSAGRAAVDRMVARLNVFNYVGALAGSVLVGVIATLADLRAGFVLPMLLATVLLMLAGAFAPATGSNLEGLEH